MTRGTRYYLAGSAIIVVLGLGTGLVAYYNGNLPSTANAPAVTELNYLPMDTAVVASLIAGLGASATAKYWAARSFQVGFSYQGFQRNCVSGVRQLLPRRAKI